MKKALFIPLALSLLALCTVSAQRPILEVDVLATDAEDGFLGLSEIATDNLALNTVARVKGNATPGDGGGGTYLWNGSSWSVVLLDSYATDADLDGTLKLDGSQSLTETQRRNLGQVWPEGAGGFFSLPATSARLQDLDNAGIIAGTANFLTVYGTGDSMGHRFYDELKDILYSRLGKAGVGLEEVQWTATSGVAVIPVSNTQRRLDVWGTGTCMQFQNGAVLEFGDRFGGASIVPFHCTDLSLYLVQESGGGVFDLDYSTDNGATWTSLESGVSTDNPATSLLLKTYSFAESSVIFRLAVTSGNVECIGAMIRNKQHKGAVCVLSASGGNSIANAAGGDQAILDGVLADMAPDLVLSYQRANVGDTAQDFTDYCDAIQTATTSADHVYFTEHEIAVDGTLETDWNTVYRARAATDPQFHVWESALRFGGFDGLTRLGWNSVDVEHLDEEAWKFQAALFAEEIGLSVQRANLQFANTYQTGSTMFYDVTGIEETKNAFIRIPRGEDYNSEIRWVWDDPDSTSTLAERSWNFGVVRAPDGQAGNAWRLFDQTGTTAKPHITAFAGGGTYFGNYNSTSLLPITDGNVVSHEAFAFRDCYVARHQGAGGTLFRGYQGLNTPTEVCKIDAEGVATFSTLDVSNWPTYADEAAADAAGIPVGSAYKTPTGELRFRVD